MEAEIAMVPKNTMAIEKKNVGGMLRMLEVMEDHIHIFVEVPPTMSVSKALNLLKGFSSYKLFQKQPWLRAYFRKGHLWSPGKFFRSVGNVTAEAIKNYIAQSNRNANAQTFIQRYSGL